MRTGVSSNTHMRAQSPGSRAAIERGCTCDPVENCAGEGRRGASGTRLFVPDQECPLHGLEAVFGTDHRAPHQRHGGRHESRAAGDWVGGPNRAGCFRWG
jgi:hypothetical protein